MLGKFFSLTLLLFLLNFSTVVAQTAASSNEGNLLANLSKSEIKDANWSLYGDDENDLFYIDFETIDVNLSTIVVKDMAGKILIEEDVLDLPVNTIYEIDFSEFGKGKYVIEMKSFIGMVTRVVEIK